MGHPQHTVSIFAPILSLTVTIEKNGEEKPDEIHFHPGGQGFWVARMLRHLGERPLLCGPVGGETGKVIRGLLSQWGIDMSPVEMDSPSPATVQDRRSGDREMLAETPMPSLDRHALDDVYSRFLDHALTSRLAVVTGQTEEIVPLEAYRRLGHDLESTDVQVVGDLHGPELEAFLEGGSIDTLKISEENLREDGVLGPAPTGDRELIEAIGHLSSRGARNVVLSRAGDPALALIGENLYRATPPELEAADFRGAGDSMTAGLAASLRAGLDAVSTLKLSCGAGAANVTRHGLGSTTESLFERLAEQVDVVEIAGTPV